ncbi:Histidine kinase osmosensor [Mucor velutinosus]|uniref:Histidine kinase osmosensor n=1 Tax=Mucor velutinosus TaxID=708070 RepID=A0AAN7HPE3_9FUNG|nr:Histidine kinase osmosensor [Mucor velutinosus]
MSKRPELVPLNLKIESSKDATIANATAFLDKFLHEGIAIHAANNTVAAQLHQLHQGLKDEKKRSRGHTATTETKEF